MSAERDGRRVFILINGFKSEEERLSEAKQLIDHYFYQLSNKTIFHKGNKVSEVMVSNGDIRSVGATVDDDIVISYPKGSYDNVKISVLHDKIIPAPVMKGQKIGEIHIRVPELEERVVPIYATHNVDKINYSQKIWYMLFPKKQS
ncbi:MAG: hypothetical protein ACTJLM_02230 [Ehrlichia sp.]